MRRTCLLILLGWAVAVPAAQSNAQRAAVFFDRVRLGSEVPWLEQVAASSDFFRREAGPGVSDGLRNEAFARLGALGTQASLEAVRRIVANARGRRVLAEPFSQPLQWPSPAAWLSGSILEPRNTAMIGGREFAVMVLEAYGPFAPYVMWRTASAGDRWSRPYLAGPASPRAWSFDPRIEAGAGGLRISFHRPATMTGDVPVPPDVVVSFEALTRDSDNDGWADIEERQLQMDPTRPDSDGDGRDDAVDVTPLHAPPPAEESDEQAQVLRAAFFAEYGVKESRAALFVPPGFRRVQLDGHAGPVFFGVHLPSRVGCGRGSRADCGPILGGAEVTWQTGATSPTETTVEFTNRLGTSFLSSVRLTLRKIDGRWVVVAYQLGRVT
jgi:hypothetical protein